jgi:N-acetylmuramoyl-L-alanine amidase
MPNKLTYLVIHCTSTPSTMKVTKGNLESWHKGPKYNSDGSVIYLGKKYDAIDLLPNDYINQQPIQKISGRGWDRLGYSDMIHRDGLLENITPYNEDDIVDPGEVTWGATGVNSISRHIVLVGGWRGDQKEGTFPFTDIFTSAQFLTLNRYIGKLLKLHPNIKIVGHRDIPHANKTCPNFSVLDFLRAISIEDKNIGL